MLMEKVLQAAKPYLDGKSIKDVIIGTSLVGIELSDGTVGISYILGDTRQAGCSAFSLLSDICDKPAYDIAEWTIRGNSNFERSVAAAVLSAASNDLDLPSDLGTDIPFDLEISPNDTVGMIGYIKPIVNAIEPLCKRLIIFDEGLASRGGSDLVVATSEQPTLIPNCDIVLISGTTTINGTIDGLLEMCTGAREIIMVGPSTPMFPEGYKGTCLTGLAGSNWDNSKKDEIFKMISLACGVKNISHLMLKKISRI